MLCMGAAPQTWPGRGAVGEMPLQAGIQVAEEGPSWSEEGAERRASEAGPCQGGGCEAGTRLPQLGAGAFVRAQEAEAVGVLILAGSWEQVIAPL